MTTSTMVRCAGVPYRQGFIEVRHGIHPGSINVECWMVDAAVDLFQHEPPAREFPDSAVIANTELELSRDSARELVRLLQRAIRDADVAT